MESVDIRPESDIDNIHKSEFEKLKENFHRNSFEEINSAQSKLRTYAKLKTETGMEDYIKHMKNITDRTTITKIRLSNHELMIEKGRHQGLELDQRLCPFCENAIENEQHFVMDCETFIVHREILLMKIRQLNNDFDNLPEDQKFHFIFTDLDALKITGAYLSKTLQIRKFLWENHKQNG